MSNANSSAQKRKTQRIDKQQWIAFLAQFTKDNRGAHAFLEVLGPEVGYQVETGDRPFEGVSADVKGNDGVVWITLGDNPDDHLTHGVHDVAIIRALPAEGQKGAVLEVEATDGIRTILELSRTEDYALPPAEKEAHRS